MQFAEGGVDKTVQVKQLVAPSCSQGLIGFVFELLDEAIHKPAQRLHRMLLASGNPSRSKLSVIFAAVRRALKPEGLSSAAAA